MSDVQIVWSCPRSEARMHSLSAYASDRSIDPRNHLRVFVQFGLAIMVMAFDFGPVSGGHMNPVVSWALVITKQIDAISFCAYVVAQLIGGFLGALAARSMPRSSTRCFLESCCVRNVLELFGLHRFSWFAAMMCNLGAGLLSLNELNLFGLCSVPR